MRRLRHLYLVLKVIYWQRLKRRAQGKPNYIKTEGFEPTDFK